MCPTYALNFLMQQLAMRMPLEVLEAEEGGEVTFSLDLMVDSTGQWFLNGEVLKAKQRVPDQSGPHLALTHYLQGAHHPAWCIAQVCGRWH